MMVTLFPWNTISRKPGGYTKFPCRRYTGARWRPWKMYCMFHLVANLYYEARSTKGVKHLNSYRGPKWSRQYRVSDNNPHAGGCVWRAVHRIKLHLWFLALKSLHRQQSSSWQFTTSKLYKKQLIELTITTIQINLKSRNVQYFKKSNDSHQTEHLRSYETEKFKRLQYIEN